MRKLILSAILLFVAACEEPGVDPTAPWLLLSDDSRISFASVKAGDVGETHYFKEVAGSVSAGGSVNVAIALESVETNIGIRNDRMRDLFFQVVQFPEATLTAQLDLTTFEGMAIGDRLETEITVALNLHGLGSEYDAKLFVTRIAENRVSVTTAEPIIVNVDEFDLEDGLMELQVVAGLPSITPAVPVSASLVFQR